MEYKGKHIEDSMYKSVYENPILEFDSNEFELTFEDLEFLEKAYLEKQKSLIESGADFKNLRYDFYAVDYDYNPNGKDEEAHAEISFAYERMETEEEREKRIEATKRLVDEQIQRELIADNARRKTFECEVSKAIDFLKKNGYTVNKN